MQKPSFKNLPKNPAINFLYFLSLGVISLRILFSQITLETIMQLVTGLIFIIFLIVKFLLPKVHAPKPFFNYLLLVPITLFIYLLIFSTGGLTSQFLIFSHFFAIALAFLMSPQISVSFISATFLLTIGSLIGSQSARMSAAENPFVSFLYLLAYVILVPFAYILAKEYKFKEEWAKNLEEQITTSKKQEDELLKNITEAVLVLNTKFELIYLNEAASKSWGLPESSLGKYFFSLFSLKDSAGRSLSAYSLPLAQTLKTKTQSVVDNIQIAPNGKEFQKISAKFLPAISANGQPLGVIMIIEDQGASEKELTKKEEVTTRALDQFLMHISRQGETIRSFKNNLRNEQIENLLGQSKELEHLAQDFIYALKLESGEVGALFSLVDIGEIAQELLESEYKQSQLKAKVLKKDLIIQPRRNIPIKVKHRIFEKAFVLGNRDWIRDSLIRIIELTFIFSEKNSLVEIEVLRIEGTAVVKIHFSCPKLKTADMGDLFEKFHPKLLRLPQLKQTSGLEGFIAKSLIERMGGNLTVKEEDPTRKFFQVTFGEENQTEDADSAAGGD